jgi:hypothetical protein
MKVVVAVVEYISNASSVLVSVQGGEIDVVFTGVYIRLEIQSVMLVFSTGYVNYCPSNLLSG